MSFGTKGCMYCEGECNKECISQEKPKQETLEEAADKTLQDEINYWYEKTGSLTSEDIVRRAYSLGITTGAKWQSQRMYSEDDMKKCWDACERFDRPISEGDAPNFNEFIEQFKRD